MRILGLAILAAGMLSAAPAFAQQNLSRSLLKIDGRQIDSGAGVPSVSPGEQMAIACNAIAGLKPNADVRVVMTLTQSKSEGDTGYKKLLATNEQVKGGSVHVRVPDAPDLSHHTVHVQVYVTDAKGTRACDGGTIKVV
ncbi:MAG TPA: hypothetical protein VK779_03630 [Rhizomicrobium sp.]|jgi:hypothetical protein|nr:hypothetical protein [Rhizomicrobium sp.]